MQSIPAVNYLKLRGSLGQMGNDQIATYQYLSTYGFRSYILGNVETKTLFEARIPNPNITWEVATNANIGIEGALFNDKITFEFDYFNNRRTNILWVKNASVPQSTGLTLPAQNIGEVENKGFDALIGYRTSVGDFNFNISVNGGYAKIKSCSGTKHLVLLNGKELQEDQCILFKLTFMMVYLKIRQKLMLRKLAIALS